MINGGVSGASGRWIADMNQSPQFVRCAQLICFGFVCCLGCETSKQQLVDANLPPTHNNTIYAPPVASTGNEAKVRLVSHQHLEDGARQLPSSESNEPETLVAPFEQLAETLPELEAFAIARNPTLRRMQHETGAAWAKTGYVSKLPDPTVSTMFFTPPMHYEPDRQLAEVQVMQMIPWLDRLKAEGQRAHIEALVAETEYQAEQLRIIGDLRATWFKLYVLRKQIETAQADQLQLESLIKTANARVRTGDAQPGDVLMATLELSSLQEQLINYRQQVSAATAELNRLAGRDSNRASVKWQASAGMCGNTRSR